MTNPITCNHPSLKPLFDALGIQPNKTRRIVITIPGPQALVTVDVETMLHDTQGNVISELVSSHVLAERKIKP